MCKVVNQKIRKSAYKFIRIYMYTHSMKKRKQKKHKSIKLAIQKC